MLSTAAALRTLRNNDDTLPGGWPEELLSLGEVRRWGRREVILQQGETSGAVQLILLGKVLREFDSRDATPTILDVHARGDLLGVTSYLDGGNHPDTVRTHKRAATLSVPHARLRAFLADNRKARSVFNTQLARRYRHDTARAASLATDRVETRIRAMLVDLAERYGVYGDVRGMLLDLGLTRGELAGLAGTTLETVIRTVHKLRDKNLLVPDGRRFFIPDVDALRP